MKIFLLIIFCVLLIFNLGVSQTYVGSSACSACHNVINDSLGYNIVEEYNITGHPYKLNPVSGAPPMYPLNTSPGVPFAPPAAPNWGDYSYVIGGYGWKARFVKTDGRIFTSDSSAQYNHQTGGWVPYHYGEDKKYDYGCFKCHTTAPEAAGSWNGVPGDSLGVFGEPGIRCEGCHGPASLHVANPTGVDPPITGDSLAYDHCGECHQRGGKTNAVPAKGGYIRHHEQFNEMKASAHGDGVNDDLTCGSCHDAHIALRYPGATSETAIIQDCITCHPGKEIQLNGMPKPNISCEDCHMAMASKSAVGTTLGNGFQGDVATHMWKINTAPVPRDSMFEGGYVKLDANGHGAVTLDFACLQCHQEKTVDWASPLATDIHTDGLTTSDENYVGSSICATCHDNINSDLGYNIFEEYLKTGHPYKLNKVNGMPPTYPANTSAGVPNAPPAATNWDDYSYVIGGFGWKARFVKTNGRIFTTDSSAQYNLATGGWVPYHYGEDKKYDQGCFKCHTTGASTEGSWNGIPADSLGTFSEPGIRCEGCHGPSGAHVADPHNVAPPVASGDSLNYNHCGECHQRGGKTNAIPASGGYIRHHEQYNEMKASKHGAQSWFTCATCHDSHVAVRYPDATNEAGISNNCESCHTDKIVRLNGNPKPIDCEDCHMANASKSAVGTTIGNGFRGDVATHIWQINATAVPRDSMFDGGHVKLDGDGLAAVTLDFACLACHSNNDLAWAASYADSIHQKGITTGITDITENIPTELSLSQNYPNPFNPSTTIEYALPNSSEVRIVIYNLLGQEMLTVFKGKQPAGTYKVSFKAIEIPSGMYMYRLETNDKTLTRKMLVMK